MKMRSPIIFCFVLALLISLFNPVFAAGATISPSTYKKLTKIQEMMAENQMESAITELRALNSNVSADTLDKAIVTQTWGFAEMSVENYGKAIELFEESLAVGKLPEKAEHNVRFLVAQLYAAKGDFVRALQKAEVWIQALESPTPTQQMFIANLFAQNKRYAEASQYAQAAIDASDSPKESWYQLLLATYFEQKKYNKAANVLQDMLARWTSKANYWEQLASVYLLTKNDSKALATLKMAWMQGYLEKESTVKSLIQLTFSRGIPEQGARLLTQAMDKGLLARDKTNLKMLADAWTLAREDKQAITALSNLAAVSSDGEAWLKQARIYLDLGEWSSAQKALDKALKKGVKKMGQAWLLSGIALVEEKRFEEAKKAFRKALGYKDQTEQATAWLGYTDDRRRQEKWLSEQST